MRFNFLLLLVGGPNEQVVTSVLGGFEIRRLRRPSLLLML